MDILPGVIIQQKYQIEEKIGQGGTGVVYKAQDLLSGKTVALKFLRHEYVEDVKQRKQFYNEIRVATHFVHESVIAVREIGEWERTLYLVVEYVEGNTLKNILKKQILPLSQIVHLNLQLLNCLSEAHERDLLHRDVKPSNIMIGEKKGKPHLLLLDFGVACWENEQSNAILGTIAYMSPEQLLGDRIDRRSDLYASAVCLYEMLTGTLPFSGNTIEEWTCNLLQETPIAASQKNRAVPVSFDRVLEKALAPDPDLRYQSATEFSQAIREAFQAKKVKWLRWVALFSIFVLFFSFGIFLAQSYQEKQQYQEYQNLAVTALMRKQYDKASQWSEEAWKIKPSEEAEELWRNSSLSEVAYWQRERNWSQVKKVLSRSIFPSPWANSYHDYLLFFTTQKDVEKEISAKNYSQALETIYRYQGHPKHKKILHRQAERIQARSYLDLFWKAVTENDVTEAERIFEKLPAFLPASKVRKLQEEINKLEKLKDYQQALLQKNYWKAMEIAKTIPNPVIRGNRLEKAEELMEGTLRKCLIISPKRRETLSSRVVEVRVFAPLEILPHFLKINGTPLRREGEEYTTEIIISEGKDLITLSYEQDQYAYKIETFLLKVDITPPHFVIEEVKMDSLNRQVIILGSAYDDSGITSISFQKHQAKAKEKGFQKWEMIIPSENLVTTEITLIARDTMGTKNYQRCTLPKENQAPEIRVLNPLPDSAVYGNKVIIEGEIIDVSGIKSLVVASEEVSFESSSKHSWKTEVYLDDKYLISDKWVIPIEAVDSWGNTSTFRLYLQSGKARWQAPHPVVLDAHYKRIWGLNYSQDGDYLVVASNDNRVSIWNTESYAPVWSRQIKQDRGESSMQFSPGIYFAAPFLASFQGVPIADFELLKKSGGTWRVSLLALLEHGFDYLIPIFDRHANCAALSPDHKHLAIGHSSGHLRVVDLEEMKYVVQKQAHKGEVLTLSFSPDGQFLASGGGDHACRIWETETYQEVKELKGHRMSVTCLTFSHDNKMLVSASRDKTVSLWNLESGQQIGKLRGHSSPISAIAFHPSKESFSTASIAGKVMIWEAQNFEH